MTDTGFKAGIEAAAKMMEGLFSGETAYVGAELAARIRSLPLPAPATDGAPTREELWTAIRQRDARINALYDAIKEACDLLTERKQGSRARSPNHNARLVLDAALKDRPSAATDGEAEKLAAEIAAALKAHTDAAPEEMRRTHAHLMSLLAGHVPLIVSRLRSQDRKDAV